MKHGKKPTVAQRKLIQSHGHDPAMWLVVKDTPDVLELVHRYFEQRKVIPKRLGDDDA